MSSNRGQGCLKGCFFAALFAFILPIGSCHLIRYNEMVAFGEELPYRPSYSDFVVWKPCDRLFGGGGYIAHLPKSYVVSTQKLRDAGFYLEQPQWDFEGGNRLLCLPKTKVDGLELPYDAFGQDMYVRRIGSSADYIVPSLRIGFGGNDPR